MSYVTTLFFTASSFGCRDPVQLSVVLTLVATTFSCLKVLYVATKFPCRDLPVLSFTKLCVVTNFLCHDTIFVVRQFDSWL